ncbi:YeaH [Klebsiella pneumoniae]|uniref:YeaH n=1 Tax=Klebsiella pneumoniae TaxID=573 RepID=A0A378BD77_KLEPN|nr:YeaH [Klebsiella pneumoniae]
MPANISVVRSLQNSLARRMAMTAGKRRELRALEEDLEAISRSEPVQLLEEERLRKEIAELRAKIERVPFIDTFDLRYKNYEKRPEPSSQADVCLMDVSGSMDQATKDMAKRFYILLYLFLSRTYKNVDVSISATIPRQKRWMSTNSSISGNRRHHCLQRPEADG